MYYLICATVLFSLSFGLIKQQLTQMPSDLVACARLLLAALVFLPFVRKLSARVHLSAMALGAVQFGLMFIFYIRAFGYLQGSEVALLTTTTPLWVAIIFSLMGKAIRYEYFFCALLSMSGSLIIVWNSNAIANSLWGVFFVQAANVCFALGQVFWKRLMVPYSGEVMASAYLGGSLVALPFALWTVELSALSAPTITQWGALIYLGVIPTGLGFWLWNHGTRQVGESTLAVMNDLKIPVGVLLAVLLFHERLRPFHFFVGASLIVGAIIWGRLIDKKIRLGRAKTN